MLIYYYLINLICTRLYSQQLFLILCLLYFVCLCRCWNINLPVHVQKIVSKYFNKLYSRLHNSSIVTKARNFSLGILCPSSCILLSLSLISLHSPSWSHHIVQSRSHHLIHLPSPLSVHIIRFEVNFESPSRSQTLYYHPLTYITSLLSNLVLSMSAKILIIKTNQLRQTQLLTHCPSPGSWTFPSVTYTRAAGPGHQAWYMGHRHP